MWPTEFPPGGHVLCAARLVSSPAPSTPQRQSILAAGLALQQAGVIPATADVKAALDSLIDSQYVTASK